MSEGMKPYDAFGPVPASVPPSQPVRHWDTALLLGLITFNGLYPAFLWLVHFLEGSGRYIDTLWGGYAVLGFILGFGEPFKAEIWEFTQGLPDPFMFYLYVAVSWLIASSASGLAFIFGARPISNQVHVSGFEVKYGKQALREAQRIIKMMKGRTESFFNVEICPGIVLPKKILSGHTIIAGASRSGKSVIFKKYLHSLTAKPSDPSLISKSFIYDPKPEFAPELPQASIVSPYHMYSRIWDIGADIRTPLHASLFAQCLIPEEGGSSNRFFTEATRSLVTGVIISLQNLYGTHWGWAQLSHLLNHDAQKLIPVLEKHYPKGVTAIANAESTTTSSVIATLGAYTRVVDDLAAAWSNEDVLDSKGAVKKNKDGSPRKRGFFSIREWVSDNNKGPNHIVVQGGTDPSLTKAFISAMVNVAIAEIQALSDNEEGRCIAFFLDELPAIGKIDFMQLVDKGASKGVVVVAAFQDIAQLKEIYGEHIGDSLQSMVTTHIYCRMSQGETRKKVANSFSSRYVASIEHGPNGKATEHGKAVVFEDMLSLELGFRNGKEYGAEGWGINCIVTTGSSNPMMLKIPGTSYKKFRPDKVPAFWTLGPRNPEFLDRPAELELLVAERDAVKVFSQDAKAFNKDVPLMRKGGQIIGLSPDQVDDILSELRPKWQDYDPRQKAKGRGFRRKDELSPQTPIVAA